MKRSILHITLRVKFHDSCRMQDDKFDDNLVIFALLFFSLVPYPNYTRVIGTYWIYIRGVWGQLNSFSEKIRTIKV